jgi:hypothetical protein
MEIDQCMCFTIDAWWPSIPCKCKHKLRAVDDTTWWGSKIFLPSRSQNYSVFSKVVKIGCTAVHPSILNVSSWSSNNNFVRSSNNNFQEKIFSWKIISICQIRVILQTWRKQTICKNKSNYFGIRSNSLIQFY